MFEECAANLQVLPPLCPTQQTGNLSHLPGFLCLDLSNALQSFLIFFFTVYVILVAWFCLNFFYLSKLALSVTQVSCSPHHHRTLFDDCHIVSAMYLRPPLKTDI